MSDSTCQTHETIYMVQTVDGTGYRRMAASRFESTKPHLAFIGVDGDEDDDTTTYWYDRCDPASDPDTWGK